MYNMVCSGTAGAAHEAEVGLWYTLLLWVKSS